MTALHKACKHISSPWALVNAKSFFFFLVIRNTLKDPSLNRHFSAEKKKKHLQKKLRDTEISTTPPGNPPHN